MPHSSTIQHGKTQNFIIWHKKDNIKEAMSKESVSK